MAKTIRTAGSREIVHSRCGKGVATVKDGVPSVQCIRRGCGEQVLLEEFVDRKLLQEALDLVISGKVNPADVIALCDPLAGYDEIEGFYFVGPEEWNKLLRVDSGNPLNLKKDWIPEVGVETVGCDVERVNAWIRSCNWRDNPEWKTRAALVLVPPIVGDVPTSLVGLNRLLGVAHDERQAGIIRKDVYWHCNYIQPKHCWANEPATDSWHYVLIYEHAGWTARKNWVNQQRVAGEKGMTILSAVADAWALSALRAVHGVSFRLDTYARVNTICDGNPLGVSSGDGGVFVSQNWLPDDADDDIGLSVQGVPMNFEC